MNYQERLEKYEERKKLLKEGIAIAADAVKKDRQAADYRMETKLDDFNERLDAYDAKAISKMNKDLEEYNRKCDAMDAKIDDDLKTIEGDFVAAEENLRIAKEKHDSKLNTARLKAQMNIHAAKARRIERLENMDKAAWQNYINYLFDYAEDCQDIAEAYALEAELAIYEAMLEIAEYEKTYGTIQ